MRIDPQNTTLQKQLHDLQAEIMALSDKQKQVVQQLRSELEKKQNSAVLKLSHGAQILPRAVLNAGTVKLQGSLKGGSGVPVLLPHLVVVPGTNLVSPGHLSGVRPPDQQAPLVPPIRVPQYPPQPQRAAHLPVPTTSPAVVGPPTVRAPKTCVTLLVAANSSSSNNSNPVGAAASAASTVAATPSVPIVTTSVTGCRPVVAPRMAKEDHRKLQLMSALGLMTREALSELQNRRGERKRRTTANPHFSNAALEEKRRNALLLGDLGPHRTRPRGRPRLGSSTPDSPEGSSNDVTANGHCSPLPAVEVRGIKKEEVSSVPNGDPVEDEERSVALGWVSDYALLKSAKAEEKQKLLKRSLELKTERMQLEEKKQHLSEIIANQQKRRVELQTALQKVQSSLEKFEQVVRLFKDAS